MRGRVRETVRWLVGQEYSGAYRQAAQACTDAAGGRYRIVLEELPRSSDQQREQLVRRLAARDGTVDVVGLDVIWTAEFAEAGWLRPWEGARAAAVSRGVLVGPLATATYRGGCGRRRTPATPSCSGTASPGCRARPRPGTG